MGKKKTGSKNAAGRANDDDDLLLEAALEAAGAERGKARELSSAGEECFVNGQWEKAARHFTDAIALDPNNGLLYSMRANTHLSAGRATEALADAKTGASLGGHSLEESAECHCKYGGVLLAQGQLQAARDAYEKGLRSSATHAGCKQGRDEANALLEKHGGKKPPPAMGSDDVEAQELRTLPAPKEVLGKGFEVVTLKVASFEKPLKFLISTTLSMEAAITPNTCGMLGMPIKRTVDLKDVSFEGGHQIGTFKECMVTSFVQAQMAEKALGTTLHGVLGLPFLQNFDLDLDRIRTEQRFKHQGAAAKAAGEDCGLGAGVRRVPCVTLPGGLLGTPLQLRSKQAVTANVIGIVDTGSMFSTMSWQAAKELGLADGIADSKLKGATKVAGATKDGVVKMPLVPVKASICNAEGEFACHVPGISSEEFQETGKGKGWTLDLKNLRPGVDFGRVNVAIGDAIPFEMLKDSAVGDYNGGAFLIGQDILAQAPRLILDAKDRKIWLEPPARIVDATPM
mmetsp:Transcript_109222/g.308050  ORF Transcript_109222/g.308050 Transcript_109222/m.308050 type:complete len:513 (-) Transcript_109222:92-1630(-)|eukprot:CAMPEP_0117519418 /NCGR_PEP_ID=MMETSP0784-20121206/32640_1 /TAXON_ID=39447 /ORGANISM="" /LENGTH=512 /DNA_ID=CAMNT_0005315375 /DNA_START=117 /DNA_END=1655 /DNA_ORIENTATION=+